MLVGVPKEIKIHEYRVGMTPATVREYVQRGHQVLVQAGAGEGIGAADSLYKQAGADIAASAEDVFERADMIVKVKEPQLNECAMLHEAQILFTYLHLAPDRAQTEALINSRCTAVAYETVTDDRGGLPLLAPMSEIAGRLAIEAAGVSLRSPAGGRGLLIGGVPGLAPARIVIIGGGVVGLHAARMAVGLGAEVTILDRSLTRLRELDNIFLGRVRTLYSTEDALDSEVLAADVVIGAVLVPGASAPKLISREKLKSMKKGAVLVDVAIDQGGCFETSKPTTHDKPTYEVDGVIHYCVANMPGCVPITSSYALNNATLPFGLALASGGIQAIALNPYLRAGINVHRGKITYKAVADSLNMPYVTAEEALAN